MTQYVINIGTVPNDGTGDPLRTAFNEVNLNFDQVFESGPVGSNVQIANNTILTTNTNGNLVLAPNGTGLVQANVNIVPNTSNTRNLGSSSRRWSELYVQYANISSGLVVPDLTATGNVTVGGNLSVTGNIINVANIITDAKTIQLANTAGTAAAANGSGITVGANDSIATFLFSSANTAWATNIGLQVGGPVTGTSIAVSDATVYGNLDAINGNFTGTVTSPNIVVNNISSDDSTFVTIQDGLDVQGDITAETLSVIGNVTADYFAGNGSTLSDITGGNVTGQVANSLIAGTVYTNAQPNITSLGTLTNVSISGNATAGNLLTGGEVSATGNITGNYFIGNGSQLTGMYANANAVAYGAAGWAGNIVPAANVTYSLGNSTNWWSNVWVAGNTIYIGGVPLGMSAGNVLTVGGNAVLSNDSNITITTTGNITADYFFGNGSQLTGLNTSSISNGTSNVDIPVANGNVTVTTAGTYGWTFDNTGNLTLPQGGIVYETSIPGGTLSGNTIALKPQGGIDADQQLLIYPTAIPGTDDNHLHLTSGNLYNTELFLGSDNLYVKLANTGNVVVNSNDGAGSTAQWTFDYLGQLQVANLSISATSGIGEQASIVEDNGSLTVLASGTNGIVNIGWANNASALGDTAVVWFNEPGNVGNVVVRTGNTAATSYTWAFDNTGNLTTPQGMVISGNVNFLGTDTALLNPADNTPLSLFSSGANGTITSFWTDDIGNLMTSNIAAFYLPLQGTQTVRIVNGNNGGNVAIYDFDNTGMFTTGAVCATGNVYAGNVSASGNVTGGNVLTGGLISATGNITGGYIFGDGSGLTSLPAPVVTQDISSNGAMSIMLYDGNIKYNNYATVEPSSGNITGGNILTGGLISATGNITSGNIITTGNVSGNIGGFAIGYRDIPQVAFTGNATIATVDAGKHFYSTQSTDYILTIANNASQGFQVGAAITVVNQGTGNITVAQGSGVTLYLAGNATSGNRTVATFGMATVMKVATDTWFINGTGVS